MAIGTPQNIELTQVVGSVMYNLPGTVTVKGILPSGATHFRIYLSEQKGVLGSLAATVPPNGTFTATKGKLFHATVRGYSATTTEEGTNTNQQPLQMVESLFDKHGLCFRSFYHEPDTNVIWATAFKGNTVLANPTDYVLPFQNVTDIVLVKSSDYFDTYELVHTFNKSFRLDAYLGVWKDSTGCIYVSARPKILISRDNGQTFQELWSNSTDLADQRTPWNFSEVNGTIFISEYANGPAKIYNSSSGTYIDDAMPAVSLPTAYTLHVSSDPNRVVWQHIDLYSKTDRHCHNFKVHPKYPNIWLLATGDNNPISNPGGGRGSVAGFWISKDSGATWTHIWNPVADGGKLGPTGLTFWDDGSVIIGLDIGGAKVQKVDLNTYECTDLFPDLHTVYSGIDSGFIMDVKAITGSKETYIQDSAYYINYNYGIVRYEGDTGKYNLVVQTVNTHSAGGENFGCSADGTIPAHAKYVFSDMAYGSRIPREYTTLATIVEESMSFGAQFDITTFDTTVSDYFPATYARSYSLVTITVDTIRKITQSITSLSDSQRKVTNSNTLNPDTKRKITNTNTATFDTLRKTTNSNSTTVDTKRSLLVSNQTPADTQRRLKNDITNSPDTVRKITNTNTLNPDTKRIVRVSNLIQVDTRRFVSALVTTVSDTLRQIMGTNVVTSTVDTLRRVIVSDTNNSDAKRNIHNTNIVNSDTKRSLRLNVQNAIDTVRKLTNDVTNVSDTMRQILNLHVTVLQIDTLRKIVNSQFVRFDSKRSVWKQVQTWADTIRRFFTGGAWPVTLETIVTPRKVDLDIIPRKVQLEVEGKMRNIVVTAGNTVNLKATFYDTVTGLPADPAGAIKFIIFDEGQNEIENFSINSSHKTSDGVYCMDYTTPRSNNRYLYWEASSTLGEVAELDRKKIELKWVV